MRFERRSMIEGRPGRFAHYSTEDLERLLHSMQRRHPESLRWLIEDLKAELERRRQPDPA
jgi:hypothetical protein